MHRMTIYITPQEHIRRTTPEFYKENRLVSDYEIHHERTVLLLGTVYSYHDNGTISRVLHKYYQ